MLQWVWTSSVTVEEHGSHKIFFFPQNKIKVCEWKMSPITKNKDRGIAQLAVKKRSLHHLCINLFFLTIIQGFLAI